MTIGREQIAKIGKLIPRLASDHDGEVVATARAIIRTLGAAGADLHDLVAALDRPALDRIVYRDRPVQQSPRCADQLEPLCRGDVLKLARFLLHKCRLPDKEAGFVAFVIRTALAGGDDDQVWLTEKQQKWFVDLVHKHNAMERAA
ncbi:hypothetical protein [Mesorhizobium sp. M0058]|uniref:hypothetical protein n=1 Tax=Mesorhizobium sp. M0058 TaxID=2956865 RepID=UPI0033381CA1